MQRRTSLRGPAAVVFLALAAGCRESKPPDPAARAEQILSEAAGDEELARRRWAEDPGNASLGLTAVVAGRTPETPLTITTTRELSLPSAVRTECVTTRPVYYRTTVSGAGQLPIATFRWNELDDAFAGQKQVRSAVAKSQGDEGELWRMIESSPELDGASVRFEARRETCGAGRSCPRKWGMSPF